MPASWKHGRRSDGLRHLDFLRAHPIDSVPGWARFVPVAHQQGQVVPIAGVGSFLLDRPEETLQKRLARGMAWEAPIALLLMEIASLADPGSLVVEVGANIGTHTVALAKYFAGRVLAFEPLPENHQALLGNLGRNGSSNVVPLRAACSDGQGTGRMVRVLESNRGMAQLDTTAPGGVRFTTLDDEVRFRGAPVSLVKMDVEGHEEAVLRGAGATLRRDRPLVLCELVPETVAPVHAFMEAAGYRSVQVFRSDWLFIPD